ncbi:MAG: hypothetical protein ACM3PU_08420 [Gemmatimonadota bacterium]
MNRNPAPDRPIDYDAFKVRALALREQEIDRLLRAFANWLAAARERQPGSSARRPATIAPAGRC